MQGKGFIKVIAVILVLLSAYQLLFTWKASDVETKAETIAIERVADQDVTGAEKDSLISTYTENYLDSVYDEPVFLNFFKYKQVKAAALKLGLDLQGGMSVVMEADIQNLIKNLSDDSQNANFLQALEDAREAQTKNQKDFVDNFIDNFKGSDQELSGIFQTPDNDEALGFNAGKEKVRDYLKQEAQDGFESTYDIIQSRIDQFGLLQPSIQRQDASKRIIVEIPGVDNPARVRNLLQSTANLEFWEMYTNQEMNQYLGLANDAIKNRITLENPEEAEDNATVTPDTDTQEDDPAEDQNEPVTVNPGDTTDLATILGDEPTDSLDSDINFEKEFPLFSKLSPNNQPGYVLGFAQKKDTAKINEYLKWEEVAGLFPTNAKLMWSAKPEESQTEDGNTIKFFSLLALRGDQDGNAQLDGSVVTSASDEIDQFGEVQVAMAMNSEGAARWLELTTKNVGKPIAVTLDNKIYSYPNINEPIPGGRSSISGGFTVTEAQDLATVLKTGKLDVPAKIIEEAVVGPTLGKKSIQAGLLSLLLGIILVLVFMLIYYGKAGLIADIALLFNLFLVIGVLAAFGSTLTLPGIAGLVLTIGMAVDANVIIFERIREELARGKDLSVAIRDGYKASYSAIIDANVTTFVIALILFIFGIGPIKGFATVLMIGIVTSVFTGVLFTRVIKDDMLKKKKHISYWTNLSKNWFRNLNYDFLSKRKFAYVLSGILVLASLGNLVVRGANAFDLGVDLSGGRSYVVKFDQDAEVTAVKSALDAAFPDGTSTQVKTFGSADQVKVTTTLMTKELGADIDEQAETALYEALKSSYKTDVSETQFRSDYLLSRQKVDATIADDLRKQALWLTIFALAAIFLYLLARFLKWQYGLAAVVTLAHDTLILLAVFSFLRGVLPFALEVDQAFIAALLTVIGYSINDTVVVFDRIREYLNLHPKKPYKEVINDAINSTLSRTLITSLTTLLVILLLFLFGGEVIRGFAFALLLGVIVGTYSSIFVATPIVVDLYTKGKKAIGKS